jgi:cell division protein ZipA
MPELRWTLLIIGAVFVVALALWEFRRQRQVPRQPANPRSASPDRMAPTFESDAPRVHREPTISLPELQPEPTLESRFTARSREPAQDPPVVEVDDAAFASLEVEGETAEPELPDDVSAGADDSLDPAVAGPDYDDTDTVTIRTLEPEDEPVRETSTADADQKPTGFVSDHDEPDHHDEPPSAPPSERHAVGASAAGEPIVDWPGESSRKIVALRLVSHPASRFQGRAVRQALAAEGFVLGRFDIFHKPGPNDRAVLSAASLTKPGTFTLNTIDAQRFGGISLFAVLPGPLPAQQTFDELLSTARSLNDRLQGALQDERGEPLTPTRSASIRQSLSEGSGSIGAHTAPQSETRQ